MDFANLNVAKTLLSPKAVAEDLLSV
jgi:hypothetical protein